MRKYFMTIIVLFLTIIFGSFINIKASTPTNQSQILIKIEKPTATAISKDYIDITGYSVGLNSISKINIYMDEKLQGQAAYGISRKDVSKLYPKYPNSSKSGFTYRLITKDSSDGIHDVKVEALDRNGEKASIYFKIQVQGERTGIIGQSIGTREQIIKYFKMNNSLKSESYIENFIDTLIKEASIEGVRADIAFAQIMYETNNFRFTGATEELQNNFFNLTDETGKKGASFKDIATGIRAGIQHLKAYASKAALKQQAVDPRYKYVTKGSAPYVEWLGAKENPNGIGWSAAKGYGGEIVKRVNLIKAVNADNPRSAAKLKQVLVPSEEVVNSRIQLTAEATSTNRVLYKFDIIDRGSGKTISSQEYSYKNIFSWTPEKSGTFYVIITVKDEKGTGDYDDKLTKTVIVMESVPKISSKTIVLDPGHGGYDAGAERWGYKEKDLNNSLCLKLGEKLRSLGAKVIYTRDPNEDIYVSLEDRAKFANESKADLFLSIHHDASENSGVSGTSTHYSSYRPGIDTEEVYVTYNGVKYKMIRPGDGGFYIDYKGKEKFLSVNEATAIDSTPSEAAGKSAQLAEKLVEAIASLGVNNRGVQDHNLSVTRTTTMPSVLIEAGFISNLEEAKRLADPGFQEQLAQKIAEIVADYFKG